MTNEQKFQLCFSQAVVIVDGYREEYDPLELYPQAIYALLIGSIVATLAATAVSAYGAVAQGDAAKDAAEYNSKVAKNAAEAAMQQGAFDAQQIRDKNKRILASQKAAFATNGIDPNSGTAVDVRADSAQQGEMQALLAIYTGRTSATAETARARLSQMEGSAAQSAGYVGAAGSILGGLGSAGSIALNPAFRK